MNGEVDVGNGTDWQWRCVHVDGAETDGAAAAAESDGGTQSQLRSGLPCELSEHPCEMDEQNCVVDWLLS